MVISEEIKCPFCGYGGEDLKIGRVMPEIIPASGVMKLKCSACKNEFRIKPLWDCF